MRLQKTKAYMSLEIRDAAREKGSKSAETYSKACRSLEFCPVTYDRPRDLAILAHIGEKTIAQLENRWIEYRKSNDLDVPAEPESECLFKLSVKPFGYSCVSQDFLHQSLKEKTKERVVQPQVMILQCPAPPKRPQRKLVKPPRKLTFLPKAPALTVFCWLSSLRLTDPKSQLRSS